MTSRLVLAMKEVETVGGNTEGENMVEPRKEEDGDRDRWGKRETK